MYAAVWCLTALLLILGDRQFWSHRSVSVRRTHLEGTGRPDTLRPVPLES